MSRDLMGEEIMPMLVSFYNNFLFGYFSRHWKTVQVWPVLDNALQQMELTIYGYFFVIIFCGYVICAWVLAWGLVIMSYVHGCRHGCGYAYGMFGHNFQHFY
jgi:hypothetical protein